MHDISARTVFFVQDTPGAMEFYTNTLGFTLDWTHEENGRPYVVQVSLLGLQIILNQKETPADERAGHGRIFLGLDQAQSFAILEHVRSRRIQPIYTHWGAPTMAIHDLDGNEIYIWLSDAERIKWQQAQETAVRSQPPAGSQRETCSFCGKHAGEYAKLFSKGLAAICNHCLALVDQVNKSDGFRPPASDDSLTCSFCGKRQSDGVALVAGPGVFICNLCGSDFHAQPN